MDWEMTLKYLTVLVWPATTLAICYWFKNEIAGLLNRIISGKLPGGIEFNSPPSQKTPNETVPKEIKESVAKKKKSRNTKTATETTKDIAVTSKQSEEQVAALLSQVEGLQTALVFERIYQNIFGSQIKLLEELRLRGILGTSYEDIAAYYEQTKIKWPALNSYPLESYLNYLKNGGLVEMFADGSQRKYKITTRGVDFVEYIEKSGYTKEKNF